jgi:hypothetical protein
VQEFAVLKLFEHAIHGTNTSLLLGWLREQYCCPLHVTVMEITALCDREHIGFFTKRVNG